MNALTHPQTQALLDVRRDGGETEWIRTPVYVTMGTMRALERRSLVELRPDAQMPWCFTDVRLTATGREYVSTLVASWSPTVSAPVAREEGE